MVTSSSLLVELENKSENLHIFCSVNLVLNSKNLISDCKFLSCYFCVLVLKNVVFATQRILVKMLEINLKQIYPAKVTVSSVIISVLAFEIKNDYVPDEVHLNL